MADLFHESSTRVETLLDRFSAFPATTGARTDAEELVRIVSSLHGECLRRLVSALHDLSTEADAFLERCCNDPLVAGILIAHGLHPVPLEQRVRVAVERAGGAQLVQATEDLVEVRIDGSEEKAQQVREAVHIAAPEVMDVRVVGQTISLLTVT